MTPQTAAWYRTTEAIRKGALLRPDACDRCGATERIEAHHDDYAEPLQVKWLCRRCHRGRHRELGHVSRIGERSGLPAPTEERIRAALKAARGSVTVAAEALGIHRTWLHRLMRKYGIERVVDIR